MTVGRIRRSQTVALTVIVDYECEYEVSCCLPLCPLSFVQLTIDNCDCICYNAVAEGAAGELELWLGQELGMRLPWLLVD